MAKRKKKRTNTLDNPALKDGRTKKHKTYKKVVGKQGLAKTKYQKKANEAIEKIKKALSSGGKPSGKTIGAARKAGVATLKLKKKRRQIMDKLGGPQKIYGPKRYKEMCKSLREARKKRKKADFIKGWKKRRLLYKGPPKGFNSFKGGFTQLTKEQRSEMMKKAWATRKQKYSGNKYFMKNKSKANARAKKSKKSKGKKK